METNNTLPVFEIFFSAFISVLFDKLASAALLEFARQQGIHTELNKWLTTLYHIRAVLADAEEKQITNIAVKMWLENLGDWAYDLDDFLDKISTDVSIHHLKAARTDQASTSKVMSFLNTCCTKLSLSSFRLNRKLMSEIDEISTRLEELFRQKNSLDLREINVTRYSNRITTSLVDESRVFGRENDKRVIVEMLRKAAISDTEVFSVIPIVGMGGVGKTTLAQLVYNDVNVTGWFDLKAWVCVPEDFDVFKITKMIFESVTIERREFESLDKVQVSLKEKLSNERFLLVLDDFWNENYNDWDLLSGPLRAGAPGSKIIVTTRHRHVASITSSVPAFHLKVLENEECLSLLAQHALGRRDFNAHPSLKETGEGIVRNCKGLPLAVKTLGGLLRTDLNLEYWKEIMNSKIWNIENCGILPALRLSYNHLPSHLKPLFAYCSTFIKGFLVNTNGLVLLWMAEGFLQQSKGEMAMEDLGYKYFNELVSRSFFQRSGGSELYFMHDLMTDLARVIAGKISFNFDSNTQSTEQNKVFEKARHSTFMRHQFDVVKNFEAFHGVKGLRTFLTLPMYQQRGRDCYLSNRVLTDLLPKLQCLRVLSLSGYSIIEIPESIGDLKQLRYLDLSQTLITSLPQSVTNLYNLQTLLLRRCRRLTKLPTSIEDLVNLRHLDCSGTDQLREMTVGIGKLASLRTLSKIVLGGINGLQVRELRSLSDIQGTLTIVGLDTVTNIEDAREALLSKHGLDEVSMEWSDCFDDSRNESLEMEVLNVLQPHGNLKKLTIKSYGGTKFPGWVGGTSFSNLVNLELRCCRKCTSLPSLGQLPLLKNLYISGIHPVKRVGAEFYGTDCPVIVPFPLLETLTFQGMPNWEEWSTLTGVGVFPCLRVLEILDCPSLINVSLLSLPSLRVLKLEKCLDVVLRCMVGIASLTSLTVQGISCLTRLQKDITKHFGTLENLSIEACSEMTSLWQEKGAWKSLINLRKLALKSCNQLVSLTGESGSLPQNIKFLLLERCPNLKKLPSGLNNLTSLQVFHISDCPRIACFPEPGLPPMRTRRGIGIGSSGCANNTENFSHLEHLRIINCSSLTSLPTGNLPSTLKELYVWNCTELEPGVEKPLHNCMSSLESLFIKGWLNFKMFPQCFFNFLYLTQLTIDKCPGLESFPASGLPLSLRTLGIFECENLKSLPDQMQSLKYLEYLGIIGCPRLNSFPQGVFPLNLKSLCLGDIGVPIPEWGVQRVSSLDFFRIVGKCPEVVCFPGECLLPTSLRSLHINGAVNLESISVGLQNLSSLEKLLIRCCPKLQSLPDTLLPTLSLLSIVECPLLKPRCLKERGEYWQWIAPIPCVLIDGINIHEL